MHSAHMAPCQLQTSSHVCSPLLAFHCSAWQSSLQSSLRCCLAGRHSEYVHSRGTQ